jgi:phospholipid/cholesterol/gamma-HCH transport system permease protein
VQRDGAHTSVAPSGSFDLAHALAAIRAVAEAEPQLGSCNSIEVDLAHLERLDGTGAVLLARLFDRLDAGARRTHIDEAANPAAAHLIALYRARRTEDPPEPPLQRSTLERIGIAAAGLPDTAREAVDFTGHFAASVPKAITAAHTVNWRSLPGLVQSIGADGVLVTGAANVLVGLIIGFLGVSQLARFGATVYVPELVVVAHFRELGALVTAIVVAGRSGAGLASEIATMKVSEEIDALRSLGFDPVRWLVVPRCLALVFAVPLLTLIGDALALFGGLVATVAITDMPARAYVLATGEAITANHLLVGLVKSPFLGLAIGLIACGQGLATHGGAAAVGSRTTAAVVLAIRAVIVVSAVFTCLFALLGI